MSPRRDTENIIKFFQRTLLRLGEKEEDQEEGDDVQAGVEAESTRGGEGGERAGEGDGED